MLTPVCPQGTCRGVTILEPAQLNTYDVLNADDVVFSVEALHTFINRGKAEAAEEEK